MDLRLVLKNKWFGLTKAKIKPEWGAEPGKLYFVIKHGEIIQGN